MSRVRGKTERLPAAPPAGAALDPVGSGPALYHLPHFPAFAFASCGCTLSSDWDSQGYYADAGLQLDLRYGYLNQSQLRLGRHAVNRADYPAPSDRELEQGTINRYTTLGIDYSFSSDWGVNVQIPYVSRTHSTISPGDTGLKALMRIRQSSPRLAFRFGRVARIPERKGLHADAAAMPVHAVQASAYDVHRDPGGALDVHQCGWMRVVFADQLDVAAGGA